MADNRDNSTGRLSELGAVALLLAALAWAGFVAPPLARAGIPLAVIGIVFAAAGLIETRVEHRCSALLAVLGMAASVAAVITIGISTRQHEAQLSTVDRAPVVHRDATPAARPVPATTTRTNNIPTITSPPQPTTRTFTWGETEPQTSTDEMDSPADFETVDSTSSVVAADDTSTPANRRFGSRTPLTEEQRRQREERGMAILRERLGARAR